MQKNMDSWDERFIGLAEHISGWSKDPSTRVGAVITKGNSVISIGYNGFPIGIKDDYRLDDRDLKLKLIIHAEINAIMFAKEPLNDCTIYVYPFMPCPKCTGPIIQSGISRVVSLRNDNERWKKEFEISREMFSEAGVSLLEMDLS